MAQFNFVQTEIPGVFVIEPQVFGDDRGYFMETYQKDLFAAGGIDKEFVQDMVWDGRKRFQQKRLKFIW